MPSPRLRQQNAADLFYRVTPSYAICSSSSALGKWDVGYIVKSCSPTLSGFDHFLGYYSACLSDYWYHWSPSQCDQQGPYVDLSNSSAGALPRPSSLALNGTYDAHVFTNEAVRLIEGHDQRWPMYMYLAYQNVHLGGCAPPSTLPPPWTTPPCSA